MQLIQEENFVSESACKDSEFNFLKVTRTDTWEFFSETVKKWHLQGRNIFSASVKM